MQFVSCRCVIGVRGHGLDFGYKKVPNRKERGNPVGHSLWDIYTMEYRDQYSFVFSGSQPAYVVVCRPFGVSR